MTTRQRNEEQIQMALGDVNRYYFAQHHGRDAKDNQELILFFIEQGAKIYADNHQQEEKQ